MQTVARRIFEIVKFQQIAEILSFPQYFPIKILFHTVHISMYALKPFALKNTFIYVHMYIYIYICMHILTAYLCMGLSVHICPQINKL